MSKSVRWTPARGIQPVACPPVDERPYIKSFSCPAKGVYHAVCLHSKVMGFMTHHLEGRTRPCLRSDTFCPGCKNFMQPRWEGYIGISLATNRSIWIAKVTASAYRYSETLMIQDGNLYGSRISFQRTRECNNGPLKVVIGDKVPDEKMPRAFDLLGSLSRRWSIDLSHLRELMQASKEDDLVDELPDGEIPA